MTNNSSFPASPQRAHGAAGGGSPPYVPSFVFNRLQAEDAQAEEHIPPAPLQHADACVPADIYARGGVHKGNGINDDFEGGNAGSSNNTTNNGGCLKAGAPYRGNQTHAARAAVRQAKISPSPHGQAWTSSPPPAPAWVFFPDVEEAEIGNVPPAPAWSADDSAYRLSPSHVGREPPPHLLPALDRHLPLNHTRTETNRMHNEEPRQFSPPPPVPTPANVDVWGTGNGNSLYSGSLLSASVSSSEEDLLNPCLRSLLSPPLTPKSLEAKETDLCMELCENLAFETANAALATDDEADDEGTDETSDSITSSGGSIPSNPWSEVKLDFYIKGPLGVDVATLGNVVLFKEFFEYGQLWSMYQEGLISLDDRLVEVEGLTDPKEMLAKCKATDPNTEKKIVIEHRVYLDRL